MAKRGRESMYETKVKPFINAIPSWRKKGLTEEQIAKKLGISLASLRNYKIKHLPFLSAIKIGKELLISELEESLYKTAMGFPYNEKKIIKEKIVDSNGNATGAERVRTEVTEKFNAPSVGALCFALKNLDPENWKDKQEIDNKITSGNFKIIIDGEELNDE